MELNFIINITFGFNYKPRLCDFYIIRLYQNSNCIYLKTFSNQNNQDLFNFVMELDKGYRCFRYFNIFLIFIFKLERFVLFKNV